MLTDSVMIRDEISHDAVAPPRQGGMKRDCSASGHVRFDREVPGVRPGTMRGMNFQVSRHNI